MVIKNMLVVRKIMRMAGKCKVGKLALAGKEIPHGFAIKCGHKVLFDMDSIIALRRVGSVVLRV